MVRLGILVLFTASAGPVVALTPSLPYAGMTRVAGPLIPTELDRADVPLATANRRWLGPDALSAPGEPREPPRLRIRGRKVKYRIPI